MDWGQIRPKGTRCVPCNKMCDGTHEGTAEHNRRLKEQKWYGGLELAAAIRIKNAETMSEESAITCKHSKMQR